MTEIPEHLLKRSRERRAALGGDESAAADTASSPATPAPAAAPAAATPAPAKAAAPAKPAAPVVKPDPPYVAAAKQRHKIPWWAMATLAMMPLILIMYVRGLTPEEAHASGPTAAGAEIFASACASCHAADGSGSGAGRQLSDGDLQLTFPKIEWQLNLVYTGSQVHSGEVYGDPDREGGAHIGVTQFGGAMPQQSSTRGGALSDAQILAVVCHERYDLPGSPDPDSEEWAEEYNRWCSEESPIYAGLEDGTYTFDSPELGVGTDPIDFTNVSASDPSPADEAFPAE